MPLCIKCFRRVLVPCISRGAPISARAEVMVAGDQELVKVSHFRRLAIATAALELSRREIPNWMADVIFGFEGSVLWPNGTLFPLHDTVIDEAFNNEGSFRWLSDFMRFADCPPRQAPQRRVLARLRLIDLAFRIDKPDIAQHFGR